MSQRNPMNERYTSEERRGTTKKSAASAKPKSKAAASVTVKSAKKTPEQKKAEEKAARKEAAAKQREVERKYYKPDTPRYKRLRAIWWVMLIAAIGCTTLSFVGQGALPQWLSVTTLIAAYVFIIGAFVLDFWKIKKERVAYQERMLALEEKNAKAEKQARRVQQAKQTKAKGSGKNQNRHAAQKQGGAGAAGEEAADGGESDEAPVKPQRRGLFGSGFRLSNREKMQAEKKAAKEAKVPAKGGAGASDQQ